jgi:hypothetical protein
MILPFSTRLNGKETFFVEKVLGGLFDHMLISKQDWKLYTQDLVNMASHKEKYHTIREDKNNRWRAGVMIDFFINVRQKNMFRFAPKVAVVSTQIIEIYYDYDHDFQKNIIVVWIDEMIFYNSSGRRCDKKMLQFAQNDGFDTIEDFLAYFNKDYNGKIIHWTDLRY